MANARRRRQANVDGAFYVDATCIDCGACRWMAPETFDLRGGMSRVHAQPSEPDAVDRALGAAVACPTGSIGVGDHDLGEAVETFPRQLEGPVFHTGFHARGSFGATPWFVCRPEGNVLVDSPRFTRPLVRRLEELGGVDWMFLTHRDDVADHDRFAEHFGCRRVLHVRDRTTGTRGVEMSLEGDEPVPLGDDLLVLPTPGHTRGSACLLFADRYLFTGDTLAFSLRLGHLYAFRGACWYDWGVLRASISALREWSFAWVLPGHGAPGHFEGDEMRAQLDRCLAWMDGAA